MAFKIGVLIAGLTLVSCHEKKYPAPEDVPGVYVNTYQADVIDPADGGLIGTRTVKDSLLITSSPDGFEVSNKKWLQNDYDDKGWIDSMQGEIHPMETYNAVFDSETGTLIPKAEGSRPPLFLEYDKVYWDDSRALEYVKVDSGN